MAHGPPTPMPSVNISLPPHVVAVQRKDGTHNVLFRVRHNRPSDWPTAIPLPLTAPRRGNLSDAAEVARIVADAEMLTQRLASVRAKQAGPCYPLGSIPEVADRWAARWPGEIAPRTQEFYTKSLRQIIAWSAANKHPHVRSITLPDTVRYLRLYDDRPAQRAALRRTLSALLSFAMIEGDITVHPFGVVPRLSRRKSAKRRVDVWTPQDVEQYAQAAVALNWSAGARLIRLMWETSADASDIVTWRRDVHFRDGPVPVIEYARGKTNQRSVIPISHGLAADIRASGQIYFVTDPRGSPYGAGDVRDDNRRGGHLRDVRAAAMKAGARRLVFDHLRHSAATHALECGARTEILPSLTAHNSTAMLESVYLQMTEAQALEVQRLRGIIS